MKEGKIMFEVVEAKQEYRGKNLVSISNKDMETMGINSGSLVEVGNSKKMIFRAIRSIDEASGNIGIDGETRHVLGISLGEKIAAVLSTVEVKALRSIEISVLENENIAVEEMQQSIIPSLKDPRNEHIFRTAFTGAPVTVGQRTRVPLSNGEKLICSISKIMPKTLELGLVDDKTKITISDSIGEGSGVNVHYEDIGGLEEEITKIREMVEFPMKHPKIFEKLGVSAPKGVLLTGPPGTGKTLLAKAVATETDAKFISIAGPEIMSKYHGGSEENLRAKFEEAQKNAPAIIFIDEIDAIAPKRGESSDQAEKRVVAQLLTLMDGLKSRGQVVVMAATNRPDDLDEALRRPGRFDRELRINPPTEEGRYKILEIHSRNMPLDDKQAILTEFSNKTIGFTGADLEVLCKEAALHSVKPFYAEIMALAEDMEDQGVEDKNLKEGALLSVEEKEIMEKREELLSHLVVKRSDFVYAMKMVEPSAMREVLIKKPNVKWEDVGGLKKAKEKLRELVELPLLRPELYAAAGIKPSKGVLLYGPPGTGKTLLAKAVATESNANFISIKGPELISKWVGESEKHVREIFKKAKQVSPSIIFFDEFDSIAKVRGSGMGGNSSEKVVNQILTELDGVEDLENVMIVAATNRRDLIDPAVLRPGRIDSHVELFNPDLETREEIFKVHTAKMPLEKGIDLKKMSVESEGWTGADIDAVCRNSGINSIKRHYKEEDLKKVTITADDFARGFETIRSQKSDDDVQGNGSMPKMPDMDDVLKSLPKKDMDKVKAKVDEVETKDEKVEGNVKSKVKEIEGKKKASKK
ncbi:MAG: AAA family ATPase [Nanoarchaeota archaeon]|jgi:transitional endoplasmic reticulum ATPase|nr:AAA family ATPase [Nanoarchaeota archaeon]